VEKPRWAKTLIVKFKNLKNTMYNKKNNLPNTASDSTKTIKRNVVNDTVSKPAKKPMYGTPEQRAAKAKIIQENRRKTDSTLNSNAEKMGMTREKYSKYLEKQKRKPDAKKYDTCGPNSNQKGAPCGVSKKAAKKG